MDWMDLFKQHVGKNVLNVFRQDRGYKAGTYIKIWDGREDNEHLADVLGLVDLNAGDVRDALYRSLKAIYHHVSILVNVNSALASGTPKQTVQREPCRCRRAVSGTGSSGWQIAERATSGLKMKVSSSSCHIGSSSVR
jgi:hypothetical protein